MQTTYTLLAVRLTNGNREILDTGMTADEVRAWLATYGSCYDGFTFTVYPDSPATAAERRRGAEMVKAARAVLLAHAA